MTLVHRVLAGCVALVFALTLAMPPRPAEAACGGVRTAYPAEKEGRRFAPPLAIGDSVMLGAVPQLARQGLAVNARGCRQMDEGLAVMKRRRAAGTLPSRVVVALGANWSIRYRQLRAAMAIAGPRRLLVLVTPRETGGGAGYDARVMRKVARRFPRRVRLLDWVRHSRGRLRWFAGDGLHLSGSGARAFARFLGRAKRMEPPVSARRRRAGARG